jgi:predicted PurR-regulated permease PerM
MGKATGLNPAIILLALSVWGKLLGFLGLLLAIPLTVLAWTYYQRYLHKSQHNLKAACGLYAPRKNTCSCLMLRLL